MSGTGIDVDESPAEVVRHWLETDWDGLLKPSKAMVFKAEDAEGHDAWYFTIILPTPDGDTWEPDDLAALQRAVRDKALEVGLTYPWYVLPRSDSLDDTAEEDEEPEPE